MKTNVVCGGWLAALCAGVAMAALSMVVPARAADLEFKAPAPLVGDTMLWGEGGVFWTGGDPLKLVALTSKIFMASAALVGRVVVVSVTFLHVQ